MLKIFLNRFIRRLKYFKYFIKESLIWEYESCKRCGNSFRIRWNIKDEIWNKVTNTNDDSGGSYCVDCFIKLAENKNITIKNDDIELNLFYPNYR
ncbi:MAG: hypothetical protein ACM3O3_12500 [Syntrophothermus sp.]